MKLKDACSLEEKLYPNPDSMIKSREITWLTKVHLVKAMVFPVVMYGCESWTIKKSKCWRTDAFELWCWRRLLKGPWTPRRSNQSIPKEISPEYSLEWLMLKLKLQYFGHLMWRTAALSLFGNLVMRGLQVKGWNIHWGRRSLGVGFPDFYGWWCHPTISSSVVPFSFRRQTFPVSGSFLTSWLFTSSGQTIGASASASVLPMNIHGFL